MQGIRIQCKDPYSIAYLNLMNVTSTPLCDEICKKTSGYLSTKLRTTTSYDLNTTQTDTQNGSNLFFGRFFCDRRIMIPQCTVIFVHDLLQILCRFSMRNKIAESYIIIGELKNIYELFNFRATLRISESTLGYNMIESIQ